jgi:hypothetical protein
MFSRRLAMEPLENRLLLNVDSFVTAQLKGGWLQITGDNGNNQVTIERVVQGEVDGYQVTVGDGTQLIGKDFHPVADVTKGIKADMKKGDDTLKILGDVDGDISVKMGDGIDSVQIKRLNR